MNALLDDALLLPAFALAVVAFIVPQVMARFLPEGVGPLMLNALLSILVVFVLSGALFYGLYIRQGILALEFSVPDFWATLLFFGRLGAMSGIIWLPIVLLSVASLPRKWVKETW